MGGPARNEARRPSSVEPVGRESGAFLVEQFETQTDDIEKILEHMQVERYVRRRAHNKIASPSSLVSDSHNVEEGQRKSSSTDREQEARTMAEFPQEAGDCQANDVTACVSSHSGGGTSRTGHCEASKLGTPSDADTDSGNLGPLAYGGRFGGSQIYSNTLPFGLRGN